MIIKRANKVGTHSNYLRYWWRADSEIDPTRATEDYFRVFYDRWRRCILVERYNADHRLISVSKFVWKRNKLIRTEAYDPAGKMLFYNVYRYGLLGNVVGVEHYSPEGQLLRVETEGV